MPVRNGWFLWNLTSKRLRSRTEADLPCYAWICSMSWVGSSLDQGWNHSKNGRKENSWYPFTSSWCGWWIKDKEIHVPWAIAKGYGQLSHFSSTEDVWTRRKISNFQKWKNCGEVAPVDHYGQRSTNDVLKTGKFPVAGALRWWWIMNACNSLPPWFRLLHPRLDWWWPISMPSAWRKMRSARYEDDCCRLPCRSIVSVLKPRLFGRWQNNWKTARCCKKKTWCLTASIMHTMWNDRYKARSLSTIGKLRRTTAKLFVSNQNSVSELVSTKQVEKSTKVFGNEQSKSSSEWCFAMLKTYGNASFDRFSHLVFAICSI